MTVPLANKSLNLGEVLLKDGIITSAQMRKAQQAQKESSHSLGRVLVEMGFIDEGQRMSILRKAFGFDIISLGSIKSDPLVCSLIPASFAIKHNILPIRQEGGNTLVVAMEDPSDVIVIDAIRNQVGFSVKAYIAQSEELAQAVQLAYSTAPTEAPAQPTAKPAASPLVARPRGRIYKILRAATFPILCFAPLGVFFLLTWLYDPFQQWLFNYAQGRFFDISLYGVLLWSFWAIVLFYVNGLIFKPDEPEDEAEA